MGRSSNHLTLFGHLEEVRKRLIIIAIVVLLTTIMSFTFVEQLQWILTRPAGQLEMIFVSPPEALLANIRLAFLAGLTLAMPLILYQIIAFVLPGLYKDEKKVIVVSVFFMVIFFLLGVSFGYFIVFPFSIRFFMNFASDTVLPMFTITNYLTFASNFILAFGFVYQMPLVFYLLGRFGIVSAEFLRSNRKYALLVIVVLSSVLTPPDIVSQLMMTGPLMVLYEIGIFLVVFSQRGVKKVAANP